MGRTEWNALHIVSLQTIKENYFFFCHINANAANSQSKCICFFKKKKVLRWKFKMLFFDRTCKLCLSLRNVRESIKKHNF